MAGGGGAWKVAYADFVTAMMAFFMVMWLVAQSDKTKKAVAEYFSNPSHSAMKHGGGSSMMPGRTKDPNGPSASLQHGKAGSGSGTNRLKSGNEVPLAGVIDRLPDSDDEEVNANSKTPTRLTIKPQKSRGYGVQVQFDENSVELSELSLTRLKRLLPELRGKPNKIEIRGHTTHRPVPTDGPFSDSWQLCYARSRAVMAFFEEQGIEPARMRLSQGGPYEPVTSSEDEFRFQNARVEIFLLDEYVRDGTGNTASK